jgi:uncharacterized protein (UPF0333 family)
MNEIKNKGEKKTWLVILGILVLVLTASNILTYFSLQNLQQKYNDLGYVYSNLKSNYEELGNSYNKLSQDYQNLQLQYSSLQNNYTSLSYKYYTLSSYYKELSKNVSSLYDLLFSYSFVEEAFSRTLNEEEVKKVSSAVWSATGGSISFWEGCQKIFNYITSNINDANDVDMPYISSYRYINIDGFDYITSFKTSTIRNYVQTPKLTLEIKQGDCDDQAILAYAMIKYYMKYIVGTEYLLYIARIEF